MRLISWNIQGGKHLEEVTDTLATLRPDFVALQEVKQNKAGNSARLLADELGYELAYAGAFITERHTPSYELGNAVLSRLPIITTEHVTLSSQKEYEGSSTTEPRNAVIAQVAAEGLLYIVSSHLGYSKDFGQTDIRDRQVEKLRGALKGRTPAILGIDLNSEPGSHALKNLSSDFINADGDNNIAMTWTNMKIDPPVEHRIDYVFKTSDIQRTGFQIVRTKASDHSLLVMDFVF